MNKTTFALAALALIAASCTKTEVVGSGPETSGSGINFSAYTAKPTKAAQTDVTTANFSSFEVTAIGNGATYFDNVTFTKKVSGIWESVNPYFWPAFALDFYAYNTPQYAETFTHTINASDEQTLYVKTNTDISKQEDLVAVYAGGKKENDNNEKKAIPLIFNHYLTQVVVNAKNANATYKVEVCGVKLANLSQDGTYTFYNNTYAENGIENKMVANGDNVNSATSVNYTATFDSKTLGSDAQLVMPTINIGTESAPENTTGRWYLIPQSVTPWSRGVAESESDDIMKNNANGTYLALKVRITANEGALKIYPATVINEETFAWMAVPVPAALAFAQGKKYNVTIEFFSNDGSKGAGYVDPEVPGDLDGDGVATNDNGKKIIGGAIKFDASVSEWGDTVDVNIYL